MKGSVGVIFGETGSVQFKFAVTDPSEVKRTDYVKVWHSSDGWVLGPGPGDDPVIGNTQCQ